MKPPIGRDTMMCMSLSARPGNFGTRFHNHLYAALGIDAVYKSFSTTDLAGAVGGIRALGIRGCAVSMPFKEAVIALLDDLGPSARAIDSVNTIVNDAGRLTGHNTDYGAVRTLVEQSGIAADTPFLLRGSGGMGKAVAAALRDAGQTAGTIVARNEAAGRALAARYGFDWIAGLDAAPDATMLVNVTPIGMRGGDEGMLAFPEAMIARAVLVCGAVAVPAETPLLAAAVRHGVARITGAQIAVLQALEQFTLYTGRTPTTTQVDAAAAFAAGDAAVSAD